MSEPLEISREEILIQVLRDTDLEGCPVRSEGVDFIEAIDGKQLLEFSWSELLLVGDYFARVLLRAELDVAFVSEWQTHGAMPGNGMVQFFRRITEVCALWDRRVGVLMGRGEAEGRLSREVGSVPSALFRSKDTTAFITDPTVRTAAKLGLLRALNRVVIAHASLAASRSHAYPDVPSGRDHGRAWVSGLAHDVMLATARVPVAVYALGAPTADWWDECCTAFLDQYEEVIPVHAGGQDDVVAVDVQTVCDVCVLRTVSALIRALESDSGRAWREFSKWHQEGLRILGDAEKVTGHQRRDAGAGLRSWVKPNFGSGVPGSVEQVERILRAHLFGRLARSYPMGDAGDRTDRGQFLEMREGTAMIRLRVPGSAVLPQGAPVTVEAAFRSHPFLAWMLSPSAGNPEQGDRFWSDSIYGAFFRVLGGTDVEDGLGRWLCAPEWACRTSISLLDDDLTAMEIAEEIFGDLDPPLARLAASAVVPLVARWAEWRRQGAEHLRRQEG